MKTRLLLAALCISMLPVCFAHSDGASSQFSVYASGYVVAYGDPIPCECDAGHPDYHPDCVCGENLAVENPESNAANTSDNAPVELGTEALFALAAIMLWLRFKP